MKTTAVFECDLIGLVRSKFKSTSRNGRQIRLLVMTQLNDAPPVHPISLTAPQLATAQRLWNLAGLPPVSGYGSALLAIGLGSDPAVADRLLSVDFDNAASAADAVDVLRQWRQRTFG